MAYINHKFCWHGVISTDVDKAKAFYSESIGWKVQTMSMGDGTATMFAANDIPRAHLAEPQASGVPSHWDNYLRVEDVDATTKAAVAKGGKQLVPPTDIPPGRFSVIASPSGAALSLFHEADPSSENPPAGHGSIHWVELQSTDLDPDIEWLKSTFGFSVNTMQMPTGPYHVIMDGETMVGGAMKGQNPQAPSVWLTWLQVDDVDATVERIKNNGGSALTDFMDVDNVGRMAVVQDNTGGAFGVITPPKS